MSYQEYYYIAFLHDGRPKIWRLDDVSSLQEANKKGMERLCGRPFYAFMLNTKDMSEATAHARAYFVNSGQDIDQSLRRASHTDINTT